MLLTEETLCQEALDEEIMEGKKAPYSDIDEETDKECTMSTSSAEEEHWPTDEETSRDICAVQMMLYSSEMRRQLGRDHTRARRCHELGLSPLRQVYTVPAPKQREATASAATTAFDQARVELDHLLDPGLSLRGPGFAARPQRCARPLGTTGRRVSVHAQAAPTHVRLARPTTGKIERVEQPKQQLGAGAVGRGPISTSSCRQRPASDTEGADVRFLIAE